MLCSITSPSCVSLSRRGIYYDRKRMTGFPRKKILTQCRILALLPIKCAYRLGTESWQCCSQMQGHSFAEPSPACRPGLGLFSAIHSELGCTLRCIDIVWSPYINRNTMEQRYLKEERRDMGAAWLFENYGERQQKRYLVPALELTGISMKTACTLNTPRSSMVYFFYGLSSWTDVL